MDGTHCTSQTQHMDNKSDRVDTMYGQDGREDQQQDGDTTLSTHLGHVWPRIATRDRRLWRQYCEGFLAE